MRHPHILTALLLLLAANASSATTAPDDAPTATTTTLATDSIRHPLRDSSEDRNLLRAALRGWHVSLGAGFEIGGAAPLPLPRSIRHINNYRPRLNLLLEGAAHKRLNNHWGISLGLRLETKGMRTDADVKNYHMQITEDDGGHMEGGWTGPVITKVRLTYATIPLLATYTFPNDRWTVNAGPYFSVLIDGDFSGFVHDGYIRTPDELGENVSVTHATYDFHDDLRRIQWGLQLGGSFRAYKHLYVNANLDWGLNGIFPSDYKTITFALYPIYGTLGFSYLF